MFETLSGVMKDMKVTQVKFLEIKTTIFEMKDTLDGINVRLDIIEEKTSGLENIVIDTTSDSSFLYKEKQELKKNRRVLVSHETPKSVIYV